MTYFSSDNSNVSAMTKLDDSNVDINEEPMKVFSSTASDRIDYGGYLRPDESLVSATAADLVASRSSVEFMSKYGGPSRKCGSSVTSGRRTTTSRDRQGVHSNGLSRRKQSPGHSNAANEHELQELRLKVMYSTDVLYLNYALVYSVFVECHVVVGLCSCVVAAPPPMKCRDVNVRHEKKNLITNFAY